MKRVTIEINPFIWVLPIAIGYDKNDREIVIGIFCIAIYIDIFKLK